MLDLESSMLRFYQTQFKACLGPRTPGQVQRSLPAGDVETLRLIHQLLTEQGLSVPEALAHLRKRAGETDHAQTVTFQPVTGAPEPKRYAKVLTFTSGKGGVGKSTLALNVAAEFARMGFRTALVDADLGLANVHILAGVTPRATLEDVVSGARTMRQSLTAGPRGVNILAGASGLLSLAELSTVERVRLIEQLEQLEADHDVVLLDTSAGLSHRVLDFIACADEAVIVTTGDLTAIADAYAMIKVVMQRQPALPIRLLVNRVDSAYEALVVVRRLLRCAEKFLDVQIGEAGHVLEDPIVARAAQQRTPYVVAYPRSRAAKSTRRVAEALLAVEVRRGAAGGPKATLTRLLDAVRPAPLVTSTS